MLNTSKIQYISLSGQSIAPGPQGTAFIACQNKVIILGADGQVINSFIGSKKTDLLALNYFKLKNHLYCSTKEKTVIWDVSDLQNPQCLGNTIPKEGAWSFTATARIHSKNNHSNISVQEGKSTTLISQKQKASICTTAMRICIASTSDEIEIYTCPIKGSKPIRIRSTFHASQCASKIFATETTLAIQKNDRVKTYDLKTLKKIERFWLEVNCVIHTIGNLYFALTENSKLVLWNDRFSKHLSEEISVDVGEIKGIVLLEQNLFVLGSQQSAIIPFS